MPNFRRYYLPRALVFITCVTHERRPLLQGESNLAILWETLRSVQEIHPFHLLAYVILPDHFHWIMQLPAPQPNFSTVVHSFKRNFVINYKRANMIGTPVKLWQDRFWDHMILDEVDLERHCDYIHWNPLKHGYVHNPQDWAQSSYQHWEKHGVYLAGWGCDSEPANIHQMVIE